MFEAFANRPLPSPAPPASPMLFEQFQQHMQQWAAPQVDQQEQSEPQVSESIAAPQTDEDMDDALPEIESPDSVDVTSPHRDFDDNGLHEPPSSTAADTGPVAVVAAPASVSIRLDAPTATIAAPTATIAAKLEPVATEEAGTAAASPAAPAAEPLDDGYFWRKYGQKAAKGAAYPRAYFRCAVPRCPAKKTVERSSEDGSTMEIVYREEHNHPRGTLPGRRASPASQGAAGGARVLVTEEMGGFSSGGGGIPPSPVKPQQQPQPQSQSPTAASPAFPASSDPAAASAAAGLALLESLNTEDLARLVSALSSDAMAAATAVLEAAVAAGVMDSSLGVAAAAATAAAAGETANARPASPPVYSPADLAAAAVNATAVVTAATAAAEVARGHMIRSASDRGAPEAAAGLAAGSADAGVVLFRSVLAPKDECDDQSSSGNTGGIAGISSDALAAVAALTRGSALAVEPSSCSTGSAGSSGSRHKRRSTEEFDLTVSPSSPSLHSVTLTKGAGNAFNEGGNVSGSISPAGGRGKRMRTGGNSGGRGSGGRGSGSGSGGGNADGQTVTMTVVQVEGTGRDVVGDVEDGYRWRKYGQKAIKASPYERSYFRCSKDGCGARRVIERCPEQPEDESVAATHTNLLVTYIGVHSHARPFRAKVIYKPVLDASQEPPADVTNPNFAAAAGADSATLVSAQTPEALSERACEQQSANPTDLTEAEEGGNAEGMQMAMPHLRDLKIEDFAFGDLPTLW
ncbi:unnamed protein product [Closterium sp. NIES-54]